MTITTANTPKIAMSHVLKHLKRSTTAGIMQISTMDWCLFSSCMQGKETRINIGDWIKNYRKFAQRNIELL